MWERARAQAEADHKWEWLNCLQFQDAEGDRVRLQVRVEDRNRARFIRTNKADALRQLLSDLAGKPVEVRIDDPPVGEGGPAKRGGQTRSPHDQALSENLPLTHQVLEIFGGRVVDLREDAEPPDDGASGK